MKLFCTELGLFWVTFGVLLTHFPAHATEHDLTCYAIIQPSCKYILADSTITPTLGVANLGSSPEHNFYVHLLIRDAEWGDTFYAESVLVRSINSYPDSSQIEFAEWTPEGRCKEIWNDGPFGRYEMLGFTRLTTVDYDDYPSNDTVKDTVVALLAHDVGVTDVILTPEPEEPPCHYSVGAQIIVTATVENFGWNLEHDVPVKLSIWDRYADPDTLLWENIQMITTLGWRGNTLDNPFTFEVPFPVFTVPSMNWLQVSSVVELANDLCRDDDNGPVCNIYYGPDPCGEGVEETKSTLQYSLNILDGAGHSILYTLPLPSWVRLDVFDASGRFVRNLYNDPCSAGAHSLAWDGKDLRGRKVPSGAYFVKMQAGTFTASSKLIVIK